MEKRKPTRREIIGGVLIIIGLLPLVLQGGVGGIWISTIGLILILTDKSRKKANK